METSRNKVAQLRLGLYLNLTPSAVCVAAGDKTIRLGILESQIPPIDVFHNTSLKKLMLHAPAEGGARYLFDNSLTNLRCYLVCRY